MKSRPALASAAAQAVLLGAAAIFAAARAADTTARPANTADAEAGALAPVAWMAGNWETRDATPYVEEHWTRPAGGAMLGESRAIKDGKMVEFEFLRVEARAEGIFYMPQPSGKPPVDFKFTPTTSNEAVFVNPGHADHLKKIVYRKNADGTLTARIEGENSGKTFAQEWHYFPKMSSALQLPASTTGYSWDLRSLWFEGLAPWWVFALFVVALVFLVIYLRHQHRQRRALRQLKLGSQRHGTLGGQIS